MQHKPAIVIAAYNRPHTLLRLLGTLANAHYGHTDIPLVLSIDKSDNNQVADICSAFEWKHGSKHIIEHAENLGLKQHIINCSGLSMQYGSIIMLEDDLMVSPLFYQYAMQALNHYSGHNQIAGVSLYSYAVTENGFLPFYPMADGYSNYFMQLPSSWGQAYTAQQWQGFAQWYSSNQQSNANVLPQYVADWGTQSWKKHYVQYMIELDKYFVFPKSSYSTNCGEPGVNTNRQGLFQVQLATGIDNCNFSIIETSLAVYDAWFEILPSKLNKLAPALSTYDYVVDLYGTKKLADVKTDMLLSSKACTAPVLQWGNTMTEVAQNISMNVAGNFFSLSSPTHFEDTKADPFSYYISIGSITDILLQKQALQLLAEYIADTDYKQKYPIMVLVNIGLNGSGTFNKSALNYPAHRVEVVNINRTTPLHTISQKHERAYYIFLTPDQPLDTNIATEAVAVMQKYSDINWLTFSNQQTAQLQRWNKRLINLSINKRSKRQVNNAFTVLNQTAWTQIENLSINEVEKVWLKLSETLQLYTCVSEKVAAPSTPKVLLETGAVNKTLEALMVNDIAYLRAYYKNREGLSPLVRWSPSSSSYYLADY
ncbi:MAG: hypothetical protein JST49_13890 [Bacteroidetes bacterium]|nr:hypothetical protein [Bacteroidota bacterium]